MAQWLVQHLNSPKKCLKAHLSGNQLCQKQIPIAPMANVSENTVHTLSSDSCRDSYGIRENIEKGCRSSW